MSKATKATGAAKPKKAKVKFVASEEVHKAIPTPVEGHLLGRILAAMRSRGSDYPTSTEQDFGMWVFGGLNPQNTAEVLLCSQMVVTWETGMAMLTGAKLASDYQAMTEKGNLAAKLLSIFERQFAALTKARRPPQVVTVVHEHKHVHVNTPGPTGDEIRIEGQPHATIDARTLALAPGPALLGQDSPRDTLPVAGDAARPLPNARRRTRDRRTKR